MLKPPVAPAADRLPDHVNQLEFIDMTDTGIAAGRDPAKRLSADDFAERCISDLNLHDPGSIRRLAALAPTEAEEREFLQFANQMEAYING